MQTLQPMQRSSSCSRPLRSLSGSSGSTISARVIPTASPRPDAMRASASAGSTILEVTIRGSAGRCASAKSAIALWGSGGGGTIPTAPGSVDASPKAKLT